MDPVEKDPLIVTNGDGICRLVALKNAELKMEHR
jgi:hypothetical protein